MPRISNQNRAIAVGLLGAGTPVKQVARRMGVSPNAIGKLREKFMETGQVKDRPRSGRPKVTTYREDRLVINRTLPGNSGRMSCSQTKCVPVSGILMDEDVSGAGGGNSIRRAVHSQLPPLVAVVLWLGGGITLTNKTHLIQIKGNLNCKCK